MVTKKTLLVAALVATLGTGALGVGTTFASENGAGHDRPAMMTNIAAAIAAEFDLDEADVQAVIDAEREEHRDEMRENHDQAFEDRLAAAVENGDLTQDQADSILEKRDEIQAYAESLKDETPEARKEAMKEKVEELRAWAVDNGIPAGYIHFGLPPRHGGHMNGNGPRGGHGGGLHGSAGWDMADQNAL